MGKPLTISLMRGENRITGIASIKLGQMLPPAIRVRNHTITSQFNEFPRYTDFSAMDQPRRDVVGALSLLFILLSSTGAQGQHNVLNRAYEVNSWHTLACEREQQWQCSWEVQRDGTGLFQPVESGTEFVKAKAASLPGDLDIYLNDVTKGTYRCYCQLNGGQTAELRTEVYFYSAEQRFGCFTDKVTIAEGSPLNVSMCYRSFLPEATSLYTATLVEEATGNTMTAFLRDYSASYTVEDPAPGLYYFQVSTGDHGHMNSASFNVTMQVETPEPGTEPTHSGTEVIVDGAIIAVVIVAVLLLLLASGAIICGCCVWRKKRKEHDENGQDQIQAELEGVHVQDHAPQPPQPPHVAEAVNPLYVVENQLEGVQVPVVDPPQPPHVAEANNAVGDVDNQFRNDQEPVADPVQPAGVAEANDPVVAADNQLAEQVAANGSLGIGVADTGSALSHMREVHHRLPSTSSSASNDDTVSVCKVPTEESLLQPNPPPCIQPIQEVGKRSDKESGFRGVTGVALVRTGNDTELPSTDLPNPTLRRIILSNESGHDF